MRGGVNLTPWVRSALGAVGIDRATLSDRLPAGFDLYGWADSARGPFGFRLLHNGVVAGTSAVTIAAIPDALDRLFAQAQKAQEDALEGQLAASLEARGIKT
jgi:hypothetical protein